MADNGKGNDGSSSALIVGEVVEAIRQEKTGQINVNILIQQVGEKSHNPEEIIAQTERALALASKWEENRLAAFKERVGAVIDAKTRDPDEVEKRLNNKVRRCLKWSIAIVAMVTIIGGIAGALIGGPLIVVTLLLLIGAVSIAMLGPLASGESISANDVVQILQATGKSLFQASEKRGHEAEPRGNQRKRR